VNQPSGGRTPTADAFYLPADGFRLARLWLPWPSAPALQTAVTEILHAAAEFQPVSLLTAPGDEAAARRAFNGDMVVLPRLSPRLRDIGPTFLVDGKGGGAAVDWRFNGWGGRGEIADAEFAHALLGASEVRRFRAPLTLEGSSVTADGHGTLLALRKAVFDPARNPDVTELEAFGIFQHWLNVARVIWIDEPHVNDALCTDIRAVAAFTAPGIVAVTESSESTIENLRRVRDASGSTLDLVRLPAAPAAFSYTSFLPLNGGLLVPSCDSQSDEKAADILAEQFPDRVIKLVPAAALAAAGISLASLAIPQPARLLERDRATILPRSAWESPVPDVEGFLEKYNDR
jgi:agmatine deiminase